MKTRTPKLLLLILALIFSFSTLTQAETLHVVTDTSQHTNVLKYGNSTHLPIKYLWFTPHCYEKFSPANKALLIKLMAPQSIEDIKKAQQDDITYSLLGKTNDGEPYEQLQDFEMNYDGPIDSLKSFVETTWANCVQEDDDK